MVRKGRANPFWPPVGPDRRGDAQEVRKKPASPWRPVSRRKNLISDKPEDVAGLDRFALLLLAGQPCQPQLVMHPHQRVRLHSLLVICQDKLCAPRPIRRMPPLQEPSVSAPVRRRVPLPHRSGDNTSLSSARGSCALQERAALRARLDPGQRFQRPYRARACSGLRELQCRYWPAQCGPASPSRSS